FSTHEHQICWYMVSSLSQFRLSYYPHRLENFTELLTDAFNNNMEHTVYGDFKAYRPDQAQAPCYFIHVCKRKA
ncbi:hypothetical protein GOODEAATRI_027452, partial [Goodea atripinnis]